jgi:hypothetical protein
MNMDPREVRRGILRGVENAQALPKRSSILISLDSGFELLREGI